jgi:hypothetical protein
MRHGVALREDDDRELGLAAVLAQHAQRLEREGQLAVDAREQALDGELVPVVAARRLVEVGAHPRSGRARRSARRAADRW